MKQNIKHCLNIKNIICENLFLYTPITNEVINASILFSKENNNIKMSGIHVTIIKNTIIIRKMCSCVLFILKML